MIITEDGTATRIVLTDHCRVRWKQRFPGLDVVLSVAASLYVPVRELRRWGSAAKGKKPPRFVTGTEYRYHDETGAVFVMGKPSSNNPIRVAITVFLFHRPPDVKVSKKLRLRAKLSSLSQKKRQT